MPEHDGASSSLPAEDLELARFQALLIETLHLGLAADETRARLLAHPDAAPFVDWIQTFDPRAIEVATLITRKFAVRSTG